MIKLLEPPTPEMTHFTWQVVASVTPQTILWMPSTHTLSSISVQSFWFLDNGNFRLSRPLLKQEECVAFWMTLEVTGKGAPQTRPKHLLGHKRDCLQEFPLSNLALTSTNHEKDNMKLCQNTLGIPMNHTPLISHVTPGFCQFSLYSTLLWLTKSLLDHFRESFWMVLCPFHPKKHPKFLPSSLLFGSTKLNFRVSVRSCNGNEGDRWINGFIYGRSTSDIFNTDGSAHFSIQKKFRLLYHSYAPISDYVSKTFRLLEELIESR